MLTTIFQLLLSLSLLVFIHEMGHFLAARIFKVRVEAFYLFFNPWFSLFKYKSKRSGTVYGLGWLPLGGYCRIAGMIDESLDEKNVASEPQPWEFRSRPAWQRLIIMIGGVVMNFLLAILIYAGIAMKWGSQELPTQQVSLGMEFAPYLEKAGFRDGDIIQSIDGDSSLNALSSSFTSQFAQAKIVEIYRPGEGKRHMIDLPQSFVSDLSRGMVEMPFISLRWPFVVAEVSKSSQNVGRLASGDKIQAVAGKRVDTFQDVVSALGDHKGDSISLEILREGAKLEQTVFVDSLGKINVAVKSPQELYPVVHHKYNFIEAFPQGAETAVSTMVGYARSLKLLTKKENISQLGGLGSMGKLFEGGFDWYRFWMRTAFLSIIFAVMNMLPIPALDGGHILFLIVEMIRRKPLSLKMQMRLQTIGVVLLLLLMVYANLNDVYRFIIK